MIRRLAAGVAVALLLVGLTPGTAKGIGDGRTSDRPGLPGPVQAHIVRRGSLRVPMPLAASRDWRRPALIVAPSLPPLAAQPQPSPSVDVPSGPLRPRSVAARSPGVVEGEATAPGLTAPMRYALRLVGVAQFACLRPLWARESGWRANANNPTSTAFGIAQRLDETSTDWRVQVDNGVAYIKGRYGSACAAESHEVRDGWY